MHLRFSSIQDSKDFFKLYNIIFHTLFFTLLILLISTILSRLAISSTQNLFNPFIPLKAMVSHANVRGGTNTLSWRLGVHSFRIVFPFTRLLDVPPSLLLRMIPLLNSALSLHSSLIVILLNTYNMILHTPGFNCSLPKNYPYLTLTTDEQLMVVLLNFDKLPGLFQTPHIIIYSYICTVSTIKVLGSNQQSFK